MIVPQYPYVLRLSINRSMSCLVCQLSSVRRLPTFDLNVTFAFAHWCRHTVAGDLAQRLCVRGGGEGLRTQGAQGGLNEATATLSEMVNGLNWFNWSGCTDLHWMHWMHSNPPNALAHWTLVQYMTDNVGMAATATPSRPVSVNSTPVKWHDWLFMLLSGSSRNSEKKQLTVLFLHFALVLDRERR